MRDTHALLDRRAAIERRLEEIPAGVRTVTTSSDPEVASLLRRHARVMADLLDSGGRIRAWDPLFGEIFDRADQIEIRFQEVEGGIVVRETSSDPDVVELIRAHARKVDQFIERGWEAYREETPLPEGYRSGSP